MGVSLRLRCVRQAGEHRRACDGYWVREGREQLSVGLRHRHEHHTAPGLNDGKIKTYYFTDYSTGGEEVVRQWDYVGTGDTPGLASEVRSYRTGVTRANLGTLTADGGLSSVAIVRQRETPEENGPAGSENTVSRHELTNHAGRVALRRGVDGELPVRVTAHTSDTVVRGPKPGYRRRNGNPHSRSR